MAIIHGIYSGPMQSITLQGVGTSQDATLTPGGTVDVLDCEYTQRLVAVGLLKPCPPPAAPPRVSAQASTTKAADAPTATVSEKGN
jgi:hypothetical protein